MTRIVLLGTGTSVGKSYVATALARALASADPEAAVTAVKPIESGLDGAELSDAERLARASTGVRLAVPGPLYALPDPLTPHLAVRRSGGPPIDVERVRNWLHDWEQTVRDTRPLRHWSLVETAGGVFSPLAPGVTNFELARALEPAIWILVAPDALGVLHDVTASLIALRTRGRTADHLVLSTARTPDASTGTNAAVMRELSIAAPDAVLGRDELELTEFATALVRAARSAARRSAD